MKRGTMGCLALALVAATATAQPSGPVSYVPLMPPIVGNYHSEGRLKLFKADLSLRVSSEQAHDLVKYHEPLVRHQLVMLFSKQTDETLSQAANKEALRVQAFEQVRDALSAEDPRAVVDDLLFNNLMIQ